MSLDPRTVYVVRTAPGYTGTTPVNAPELPSDARKTPALAALRELLRTSGLDAPRFSSRHWNPFGPIIGRNDRVLIKPNWVHHENASGAGIDCLVTHPSLIEAVLEYVALAQPASIVIGDAPLQSCDFPLLCKAIGLDDILTRARSRGTPVAVQDFRLVTREDRRGGRVQRTERNPDHYYLFDLGAQSFLEPISDASARFRVTMYDPRALKSSHQKTRHQYLIAREAIDANVVINLPKLKTHKKACLTGALKNMVGINGHKSYLPHHRKGGSSDGGDCYAGRGFMKSFTEKLLDRANQSSPSAADRLCGVIARVAIRTGRATAGPSFDLEGSWYGNDTVWRTVLDVQRILHYGTSEGKIAAAQQRTVVNLTDAIVGGQGEGPLAPVPADLRFLTLAANAPAAEWVHALLMGLDPARIPLTSAAFSPEAPALANFPPSEIAVRLGNDVMSPEEAARRIGSVVSPPTGWAGHCERQAVQAAAP